MKIQYHEIRVKTFDKKFGADFFSSLPGGPGIYKVFDARGTLIYVGKAKNLRRRLGQYRNAKRQKRHLKMRAIVADAIRIEIEQFTTELEACLEEMRVIQEKRPKWNVAGAFYFLYPMIGLKQDRETLKFLYTTEPDVLEPKLISGFSMRGAYRSRALCGNGFFSLMELLEYVGHKEPTQKIGDHSFLYSFRQLDRGWPQKNPKEDLEKFFRGESPEALEKLLLALVENAAARRRADEVQELLNDVRRLWRHEALVLHKARKRACISAYPIPQKERDRLFLQCRYGGEKSQKTAMQIQIL